ncbi:MAG: histidine kinase [Spirochaetales bacterium]|nr:histidine kinase [Spirochaetales bacterium]
MNRVLLWFSSIRRRVLLFSLGTVILLGLVSFYSQFNAQGMLRGVWEVYEGQKLLLNIDAYIRESSDAVESYLAFRGSDALLRYSRIAEKLRSALAVEIKVPSVSAVSQGMRRNLLGLGEEFLYACQKAIHAKRGREEEQYSTEYERSQTIAGFLIQEVDQLSLEEFRTNLFQASRAYRLLGILQLTNAIMLAALLGLAILLSFWFATMLTKPLDSLAKASAEIARGNYLVELPPSGTDETERLTEAFHKMRLSIIRSIEDIRHTSEVETENLRMKALLRNAEYQALQAQINPHFLFNTLNAAGQLAMMEEAPQTEMFLQNLARLMRHNIRKLDQPVSLVEELDSLANYIYVVRIRFGSRIRFILKGFSHAANVLMPPMTLQPLVENAILHGLKDREEGGTVTVEVLAPDANGFHLIISDDGEGMESEVLQRYLDDDEGGMTLGGQSTGIGLGNVIHRLRLFYGQKDVIRIESQKGYGTQIHIILPPGAERESG